MSPSLNGLGPASLDLPGPTDTDLAEFASRFEHVQQYEDERAKVMAVRLAAKRHFILHELTVLQEMMTRYEYMHQQYQVRYLTVRTAYETLTNFIHPQRRHWQPNANRIAPGFLHGKPRSNSTRSLTGIFSEPW
jgi:hypothetical protein